MWGMQCLGSLYVVLCKVEWAVYDGAKHGVGHEKWSRLAQSWGWEW